ncbi:helix-turn-helix domain-containing protein [Polaribacter sp.]|jgi:HTH-type transcriptional regulator, competence development regulator|uniref:helix-turn-helix domain-containing protein n=1 Tax=Polaribacter sp. TaxID=1920175 RepID=UPI004047C955
METFVEYIRVLREEHEMPLMKLVAFLDIDQSTLSKIERNERHPVKDMVSKLSETFQLGLRSYLLR